MMFLMGLVVRGGTEGRFTPIVSKSQRKKAGKKEMKLQNRSLVKRPRGRPKLFR